MSLKVVRGLRFPESSLIGVQSSFSRSSSSRHPLELWGRSIFWSKWVQVSGWSQMAVKMSSCKSCPIKKKNYIIRLCLWMLSSVKRSSGSYESASETSDQTVAQCQDKLQKLLSIMCSYGVSGPTSIPQSILRTFLKLCSNSVHF